MADGFIYFAQAESGGPIKIGYSVSPANRLRSLQTATADGLCVLALIAGSRFDEKRIHEALAAHRLRGEWFADHAEVRAVFTPALPSATPSAAPRDFWTDVVETLVEFRDATTAALAHAAHRDAEAMLSVVEEAGPRLREQIARLSVEAPEERVAGLA